MDAQITTTELEQLRVLLSEAKRLVGEANVYLVEAMKRIPPMVSEE